ncbi:CCR4-NOT transcription complex subunit 4 [Camellia lanceoleosa]|nr:CCR4-NOT transcription complex subunit 4 [Camellia lanceoleosa]
MEVNCGKFGATIVERYFVNLSLVGVTSKKDETVVLEVEPVSSWNGVKVGNDMEPSFDCWKPDSPHGRDVEFKLPCLNPVVFDSLYRTYAFGSLSSPSVIERTTVMMSNEEEKKCPLCAEEMDWTDQQLKPCKCGYEVCVWCWHHIMGMAEKDETEGRCPACRTPYDKERIVGMEANCERVVATKKDRKNKPQKTKMKKPEERKDLSSVRVIQRRMAYVIGLPLTLADEDRLQRKEYFGQYGKVAKVSLSRTAGGDIQQFVNDTCSVYITYSKEEEAIRCIQSVHGFVLEGRFLRASFGTAKYCHAWLRNMPCTNPTCLYLHSIGAEEDSFSKDEEAAVHTRNRVHQIVGDTHNMQRRSGICCLPDTAYATETSTGHMTCSYSSNDRDGRIKTPNKTFVDIVGRSSSGPEKDGNVAEDRKILNLCSDFSSVTIDTDYHLDTEYSNSMLRKVSSRSQLPIGLPRDKDSQEYSLKPFREPSSFTVLGRADFTPSDACIAKGRSCLMFDSGRQALPGSCSDVREDFLSFDDQRSKGSDTLSQESSVLPSSYPIRISDRSNGRAQQPKEMCSLSDFNVKCSTVHNHVDEASMPFSCVNSILSDGYNERKFHSSIESDRNFRSSNSFSNEEIVEHLRRLDNDNITNDDDSSALDAVESSIISNILSLDFDSCDDSSTLSHSLAELFDGNGGRHGSWNFRNSEKSMFSFAKEENSVNQATDLDSSFSNIGQVSKRCALLPDSMEHEDHYFCGLQHHVSSAPSLTPPGFSVPSRDPPPGFSAYERTNRVLNPTSGNHLVNTTSLPNSQYCAPSAGNINNTREFDLIDPAILVVGRGKATDVLNNPGLETWPTSTQPTTYEDQARLWLLMQQSASAYQEPKFPPIFMQETTPSTHQQLNFSGRIGDGFSPIGDTFGLSSRFMDQHQTYNPSPFATQLSSQQKYGNGHVSNGHWPGMDEVRLRNEVGMAEIQRNEMLGFNKFFPGYGDLMLQMPSTGDVYNRAYGL